MSKILVTGANGVVGKLLAPELHRRGHKVVGIDIVHREDECGFSLHDLWDDNRPAYYRCDVSEFRQLTQVLSQPYFDYVYHAAAEFGRWNGEDYYENLWRTNVIGTKHIIRLQEKLGFKLIHFSSSEVYGDWPGLMVETVTDDHPVKQMNDYAMTKWVNEMQIHNSRLQHGTESVVVRLFNTYGPGEHYSPYRSVNCRFLYCALRGIPFKVFRGHRRTSTYLSDTVNTLANIADNWNPGQTYNIGGNQEHSIEELADLVLKVTGASRKLAVLVPEGEPMTTRTKTVDISKAIRDLGHKNTVSLEEGLKLTADWMRKVYGL